MVMKVAEVGSMDPRRIDAAAYLFAALSDKSRLLILQHLSLGEHRVVDLTAHLGLAQSTVSKHLACLRDCGLVQVRAQGRSSFYSRSHGEATDALLAAAGQLLDLTGEAAALCLEVHGGAGEGSR